MDNFNFDVKSPKYFIDDIIRKAAGGDMRIINAFEVIPRAVFIPEASRHQAYDDISLPIGQGQTISQPSLLAHMLKKLDIKETDTILEIGSGSGYLAALLSKMCKNVYSVERIAPLLNSARKLLRRMSISNVHFLLGDGAFGWEDHAPYDKIVASAGATKIPDNLVAQLSDNGRFLIPLNDSLMCYIKKDGVIIEEKGVPVKFVDFVGS